MKKRDHEANKEKVATHLAVRSILEKQREIKVKIKSQGNCMEPAIKNGDILKIYTKSPRAIRIGDIVFFFIKGI